MKIYDVQQPSGDPLFTAPPISFPNGSGHPGHYQGGQADLVDVVAGGPGLVTAGFFDRGPQAAIWTSNDGFSWRLASDFPVADGTLADAIASSPRGLLAGGADGRKAAAWRSTDGVAWAQVDGGTAFSDPAAPLQISAVTAWGTGWVAAGYLGTYAGPLRAAFWTSPDGIAWQRVGDAGEFTDGRVNALTKLGTRLVAVGGTGTYNARTGGTAWTSDDGGASWSRSPSSPDLQAGVLWGVAPGGPGLVAVGSDPDDRKAMVWTSTDGVAWTRVPDAPALVNHGLKIRMQDVAKVGAELIAGGHLLFGTQYPSGAIWHSTDGVSWERAPDTAALGDGEIGGVVAGGPGAVAVGAVGSPDFFIPTVWLSPGRGDLAPTPAP
ncbi:MAG: WD40/YVTN/BNR-like repeat-containing protein [Candidatus Limnocylindrales bacterium]